VRRTKAIELRRQILAELSGTRKKPIYALGLQSAEAPAKRRAEARLAVGYSRVGDNPADYILELRVQRKGVAFAAAEKIADHVNGDANIEIIPEVTIQPRAEPRGAARVRQLCQKTRPLHLGLSIGHADGASGTLGGFVELERGDGIISCSHVIALLGDIDFDAQNPIYQPGPSDRKPLTSASVVANLTDAATLSTTNPNESDSAVALLRESVGHEGNVIPRGFPLAGRVIELPPDGFEPMKRCPVYKLGKATGLTEGTLAGYGISGISVKTCAAPPRNYLFNNVIQVDWRPRGTPFSQPGDSGSLLFVESGDSLYALGMVFAGGYRVDSATARRQRGVSFCGDLGTILATHNARWL